MSNTDRIARCELCGAAIMFRYTASGKRMTLDKERVKGPAYVGMYRVVDATMCAPAEPMFDPVGTVYHRCHFDTCENADQRREGR